LTEGRREPAFFLAFNDTTREVAAVALKRSTERAIDADTRSEIGGVIPAHAGIHPTAMGLDGQRAKITRRRHGHRKPAPSVFFATIEHCTTLKRQQVVGLPMLTIGLHWPKMDPGMRRDDVSGFGRC
jgi:hypothetical protein